jgi:hypothetical protein
MLQRWNLGQMICRRLSQSSSIFGISLECGRTSAGKPATQSTPRLLPASLAFSPTPVARRCLRRIKPRERPQRTATARDNHAQSLICTHTPSPRWEKITTKYCTCPVRPFFNCRERPLTLLVESTEPLQKMKSRKPTERKVTPEHLVMVMDADCV